MTIVATPEIIKEYVVIFMAFIFGNKVTDIPIKHRRKILPTPTTDINQNAS